MNLIRLPYKNIVQSNNNCQKYKLYLVIKKHTYF